MKKPSTHPRLTGTIDLTDDNLKVIDLIVKMSVEEALVQYLEANPPGDTTEPKLLTKQQAADLLQVSVATLDKLRKEEIIKTAYVGHLVRISPAEITKYIA